MENNLREGEICAWKKNYLKNVWWKENFGPDKIYPKILGS